MRRRGLVRGDAPLRQPERILIRGARLVDRPRELDRVSDLYVADGRIVGIGAAPGAARFEADRSVDGKGLVLTPGLFDLVTPAFSVLVVFVLAEVFKEGARLRRESELTI